MGVASGLGHQTRRWRRHEPRATGTAGDDGSGTATTAREDAGRRSSRRTFEEELEFAAEERGRRGDRGQKRPNVFIRLYRGETSFDFIGNRRWWFGVSALDHPARDHLPEHPGPQRGHRLQGRPVLAGDLPDPHRGRGHRRGRVGRRHPAHRGPAHQPAQRPEADPGDRRPQLEAGRPARQAIENNVQDALAKAAHTSPNNVSFNEVGATWGSEVTRKAIEALIIFFIVVTVYISIRFEFKMAVAAIVAVVHDILVTVGIYSLAGFQVTPDTVVAVLTVLGYSLYDTVVVFDRIRDNAQGLGAVRSDHLLGHGQPVDEPDAGPVDQHLAGGHHPGAVGPGDRVLLPRGHLPAELRTGPGHRADQRGLLVDLHRLAAAGPDEGARAPLHHHPPAPRGPGRTGRGADPGHGRGHGRRRRRERPGLGQGPQPDRPASSVPGRPRPPGRAGRPSRKDGRTVPAPRRGAHLGRVARSPRRRQPRLVGLHPARREPPAAPPPQGQGQGQGRRSRTGAAEPVAACPTVPVRPARPGTV